MEPDLVSSILSVIATSTGILVSLFFAVLIPSFLKRYDLERELSKELSDIKNQIDELKQKGEGQIFNLMVNKAVKQIALERLPTVNWWIIKLFLGYGIFVFSSSLLLLATSDISLFKVLNIKWIIYILTLFTIINFILLIPFTLYLFHYLDVEQPKEVKFITGILYKGEWWNIGWEPQIEELYAQGTSSKRKLIIKGDIDIKEAYSMGKAIRSSPNKFLEGEIHSEESSKESSNSKTSNQQ